MSEIEMYSSSIKGIIHMYKDVNLYSISIPER